MLYLGAYWADSGSVWLCELSMTTATSTAKHQQQQPGQNFTM
ncbi:hypothetical protein AVDCRST_MAG94-5078 [uncultured Leptolyngbya sp.]|uniref:Uncharacterized protein n=1 Tax=uncultured Leptolyngbya sp. TaxID=332963 RepID=A0A6J4NDG5_9CYAN|nr:hypothetical protein AVDCRST_MAG94-5078 [uncultured Leptolyngbya sp.]